MYTKWAYNNTGSLQTYKGQDTASGAYYQLHAAEEKGWALDDDVLVAIASGDLIMSSEEGVNGHITVVADALNFLQGNISQAVVLDSLNDNEGVPLVRHRAFANADDLRFRGGGGASGTITAGTTDSIDFLMPEDRFVTGAEFLLQNQVFGDSADFQVIDKDNVLGYGANFILDEFATSWFFSSDSEHQGPFLVPYPALVYSGLYIRTKYYSTGNTDVNIGVNYYLHKKPV